MEDELVILSPEKTLVTFRLAGMGSRIIAHILDVFILAVGLYVLTMIVMVLTMFAPLSMKLDEGIGLGIMIFLWAAAPFAYFILFEGLWNGQTLGKKAAAIRVRMADGTPIRFSAAVGRNLMRPADMMPGTYFAGLLAILFSPRSQRLGDLVANTVVVHEKRPVPTFAVAPHAAGIHPFESKLGDLRGMSVNEYNALRRFCDRFPEMPASVQERLVKEVWIPIAARHGIPSIASVHPLYMAEATVMRYGRQHGLL